LVEVGSIEIGGKINTSEIERGQKRIERGFNEISNKGKSVGSDFERISTQGKRLVTIFGGLAIAGTGAMLGLAKGAPAVAGSMAKIQVAMLKLKMAAGEALKPTFDAAANSLDKLSNWVDANPNLFRGIINSMMAAAAVATIYSVGGWVYRAFKGFFALFGKIVRWTGWATIRSLFKGLGTTIGNVARSVGSAFSSIISWFSNLASKIGTLLTGGATGGILRSIFGVGGAVTGMALPALINTYQRESTGQGYLDQGPGQFQGLVTQKELNKWSRNKSELDMVYFM